MCEINKLAEMIQKSTSVVFFGGAGVSTESGIPDFRSESGLYKARSIFGHSPEEMLSHDFFVHNTKIFFRYYKENLIASGAKPNDAHKALAILEKKGYISAVITQNIDGLHQAAGSETVYELHGATRRNYCVGCRKTFELSYIMDQTNCKDDVPICESCGSVVRPDVVLYGEGLDGDVIDKAVSALKSADMLIIGGTSLSVYPAAAFLDYYVGRRIAVINKSEAMLDDRADVIIREPIGVTMKQALCQLGIWNAEV